MLRCILAKPMADLLLKRTIFTDRSTIGELYRTDTNEMICYILEDEARALGVKIKDKTCIPAGDYKIRITPSNRFKRDLPLIYNTPQLTVSDGVHTWEGIRIHAGNSDADSSGCQLPGTTKALDIVYDSRKAFDKLFAVITEMLHNKQELTYTIVTSQQN